MASTLIPRLDFLFQAVYRSNKACPHCKSANTKIIARKLGFIKLRRCDRCTLCFTDPIYEPSLGGKLYDDTYAAEGLTTDRPNPSDLQPLLDRNFEGTDKYFGDRIARIRQAVDGDRLLEIGSSWGYFLFQANQGGFDAHGIEIGAPRRNYGVDHLGVHIEPSFDAYEDRGFDIVYTSHVLEHFTDLSSVFSDVARVLKPGGHLLLEVPRFDPIRLSKADRQCMGAVHPLGFTSEFFICNLPAKGFEPMGFFDRWEDFPQHPRERSREGQVILMARRSGSDG